MRYPEIARGIFLERPNRFIAIVEINGAREVCHVKNTGRCRELLVKGREVILAKGENPSRKTKYDLIAVNKNGLLINMDSQAPNRVFAEWAKGSGFFGENAVIRPEYSFGDSRLDFYIESGARKILVEVKGVTLEEDGVVLFPDAPTERGVKHIRELQRAVAEGYESVLFFVIQMSRCRYFTPNRQTHKAFADALKEASDNGVRILAATCCVEENSLSIADFAEIRL